MDTNNSIKFDLEVIPTNQTITIDGINFSGVAYILLFIDDICMNRQQPFDEAFVIFEELHKSVSKSGKYLLFTSVSGIADDAGWNPVEVIISGEEATWMFEINDLTIKYSFDKNEYDSEIKGLEEKIMQLPLEIKLEPISIIWPEE